MEVFEKSLVLALSGCGIMGGRVAEILVRIVSEALIVLAARLHFRGRSVSFFYTASFY